MLQRYRILIPMVTVVVLAGCSSSSLDQAISKAAKDGHNISDLKTCSDFVQLKKDVTAGILSDQEQRDHVKAVYDESAGASTAAITTDATALLAALTQNDSPAQVEALTKFTADCNW